MNDLEKSIFSIYKWKLAWPILSFLIPYILCFLGYWIFGEKNQSGQIVSMDYKDAFHEALENVFTLFIAFILVLFSTIQIFTNRYYKIQKEETEQFYKIQKEESKRLVDKTNVISKHVDEMLSKSKIVFESGINEFDSKHLLALKRILNALSIGIESDSSNTNVNIYAIDNSDPRTWWSDTMTGYLALLSNWHRNYAAISAGQIYRIFVCDRNELLSPVFVKTISLHSLMGFKTYVISQDLYDLLYASFKPKLGEKLIKKKELVIWSKNDETNSKSSDSSNSGNLQMPLEISFNLDKLGHPKTWQSVKGYQSFWDIGTDFNERLSIGKKEINVEIENFYGKKLHSNDIDIWFDFIATEKNGRGVKKNDEKINHWNVLPIQHLEFIDELIKKCVCCKDPNEVPEIVEIDSPFGIEIKTSDCQVCLKTDKNSCHNSINLSNGTKFDFVSSEDVSGILRRYYNNSKTIKNEI